MHSHSALQALTLVLYECGLTCITHWSSQQADVGVALLSGFGAANANTDTDDSTSGAPSKVHTHSENSTSNFLRTVAHLPP
jgi:hypothetical protein